MPALDLTIVRVGDPPPWPDVRNPLHLADPTIHVAAIQAGMVSGAPSIAIRVDLGDGDTVIAETSLAAWIAVTAAIRGAFPDAFTDGPLAPPFDAAPRAHVETITTSPVEVTHNLGTRDLIVEAFLAGSNRMVWASAAAQGTDTAVVRCVEATPATPVRIRLIG